VSEEVEDVPVVETEPVSSPADPAGDESPTGASPSEMTSDEAATQISLDSSGNALEQNAKQAYQEQYTPSLNQDSGHAPLTQAGRDNAEREKEEKKSELSEHIESQSEHRKKWMDKDHDFGGLKISGHDLEKLMNFISNPAMQDKLRERMGKTGMSKDKIDKGMKELNEYIDLKKKEQEGKLDEEGQRRLRELEKSEEFKAVAAAAAQQARENGIDLSGNRTKEAITAVVTDKASLSSEISNQLQAERNNFNSEASNAGEFEREGAGKSAAYAHFTNAPHLSDEFTAKVAAVKPSPAANDVSNGFDTTTPAAVVAQAQVKPKTIDVSFG